MSQKRDDPLLCSSAVLKLYPAGRPRQHPPNALSPLDKNDVLGVADDLAKLQSLEVASSPEPVRMAATPVFWSLTQRRSSPPTNHVTANGAS